MNIYGTFQTYCNTNECCDYCDWRIRFWCAVFVPYIKGAPTIEAAPVVHGRWIDMQEDEATEGMWRCSACDSDRYFDIMTPAECGCYYCPNCGAKMDLKSEETN